MDHPVERFRRALREVPLSDYPPSLTPVNDETLEAAAGGPVGVAAFPLSHGLYAPSWWDHGQIPPFPLPGQGVMIIANHPDSEADAMTQLRDYGAHGDPGRNAEPMKYWRNLYRILDESGVGRSNMFATNVHPAFNRGRLGTVAVAESEAWTGHARRLLLMQLVTMQPRLVLVFGGDARAALSRMQMGWPALELNSPVRVRVDQFATTALYARHPSASYDYDAWDARVFALWSAWTSSASPSR